MEKLLKLYRYKNDLTHYEIYASVMYGTYNFSTTNFQVSGRNHNQIKGTKIHYWTIKQHIVTKMIFYLKIVNFLFSYLLTYSNNKKYYYFLSINLDKLKSITKHHFDQK